MREDEEYFQLEKDIIFKMCALPKDELDIYMAKVIGALCGRMAILSMPESELVRDLKDELREAYKKIDKAREALK